MENITKVNCLIKALGKATKIEFNGMLSYNIIVGLGSKYVEGEISAELLYNLETEQEIISFTKSFEK